MITNVKTAKSQLSEFLRVAQTEEVTILSHNKPMGVLVSYHHFQELLDYIEDLEDKITLFEYEQNPPDIYISADKVHRDLLR